MSLFDEAVALVLLVEGGYNPDDEGSPTNFGIRQVDHPGVDVKTLTMTQAVSIYKTEYWDRCNADQLPPPVAVVLFDAAVDQGPGWAKRTLQHLVGVAGDGVIGPETVNAVATRPTPLELARAFSVKRLLHYSDTPGWSQWGTSWVDRTLRFWALAVIEGSI